MDVKRGSAFPCPFLTLLVIHSLPLPLLASSHCNNPPVIFNFGDSNSDTGGFSYGLGLLPSPPYGRAHFDQRGRYADGRLIIDFLCESLNASYLTPYLESLGPNFTTGANFAISGAATYPRYQPFSLDIQVSQFLRFRSRSPQLISIGYKDLVREEDFTNALYMIDIGQNDLAGSLSDLQHYSQAIQRIPSFIEEIKFAIWNIYQRGGKNFWVHNTGPLGCLPQKLAMISHNASDLDQHGCLQSLNNAAKIFNQQLWDLREELRSEMKNATIVYVDMYAIKFDLIANATTYGFEDPFMVCCGFGGPPYNFIANVICGQTGYNVCKEGLNYVSWDGVHYTEAANAIFASKILSTNYSTPPIKPNYFCNM